MSVNMGQAVGYLDLNTSKFKSGLKSALNDLKTFQAEAATTKDKLSGFILQRALQLLLQEWGLQLLQ